MKKRIITLTLLVILFVFLLWTLFRYKNEKPEFRGFGWYGYLADDEITEESLQKIRRLGGNSININVYYEYNLNNSSFILKSNLTKIEEKIDLAHEYDLKVFLSPFANLVGGHYMASQIEENIEKYLEEAKKTSIQIAGFSQENNVEMYGIWNEMGLSLIETQNSTEIVSEWIQNTREEVDQVYSGILTTKEGVQTGAYRNYNFSGFDYIGVTFYPFTTSHAIDPNSGMKFSGVENLDEYKILTNEEIAYLLELKDRFKNKGVIIGEIGIDVVNGEFLGNSFEDKKIRSDAYEILLENGKNKIDGFFFSRFEYENGGSPDLDEVFIRFFSNVYS